MLTPALSITGLSSLPEAAQGPRALIEWAAGLGYSAVQLDGTLQGIRARDLDRSARRDLAALLRRLQLSFSGLDLWIPPAHFSDPAHQDRAVSATISALELSAEVSRLCGTSGAVVSFTLSEKLTESVAQTLTKEAERVGAVLADHAWPGDPARTFPLSRGVDPAMLLMANANPASEVSKFTHIPASARLSDADTVTRVAVGDGRLDILAYTIALETKGYNRPVIVDLRAVRDPSAGALAALAAAGGSP